MNNKFIPLILLATLATLLLISCSAEFRAKKAVPRIGAEPLAKEIIKQRPDIFTPREVTKDSIVRVPVIVEVPQIDTVLTTNTDTIREFNYEDKNLKFSYYGGHISYKIKPRFVHDTITRVIHLQAQCPPVPSGATVADAINEVTKQKDKYKDATDLWRKRCIILACVLLILAVLKLAKLYFKM